MFINPLFHHYNKLFIVYFYDYLYLNIALVGIEPTILRSYDHKFSRWFTVLFCFLYFVLMYFILTDLVGFDPTTLWLTATRSSDWATDPLVYTINISLIIKRIITTIRSRKINHDKRIRTVVSLIPIYNLIFAVCL